MSENLGTENGVGVVVVSAPAGFGKTTAVTEWIQTLPVGERCVAWLSLDERDNDPVTFWTYVVAALRAALGPDFGSGASALMQSSRVTLDAVVVTLLNEMLTVDRQVVLVLDDYHVISTPEIHQSIALLLERLSSGSRVVIASRSDPPLPLGRLRASGRLVEVRAKDLRFTVDETAEYLAGATGTTGDALSSVDIVALAERTEGWVAALQMAAISLRGRNDVSSFIADFAGDDRYIVDYLAEEVLDGQTDDVRQFLLRTSILNRLSGPLCDAVTGQSGGRSTLDRLERANMFLVPLDDRRHFYRYHHLFADVLRAHLNDEDPQAISEMHRRASAWFESNGGMVESIHHALAAGDPDKAADLMEAAIPEWQRSRQEATIRNWLQRLPADVMDRRPVLIMGLVGALASIGEFADDTDERLDRVEQLLSMDGSADTDTSADADSGPDADFDSGTGAGSGPLVVVADEAQLRELPAAVEMYRAALALMRGDFDATKLHGSHALDLAPEDEHLVRAAALVGLAAWARGDITGASDGYTESMEGLLRAGHTSDVLGCSITLADLRLAQGRLREAKRIFSDGVALGSDRDGPALRGTADMHVGLSEILREMGDLEGALEQLELAAELGDHNGLPQNPYRSRLAMARVRTAQGDMESVEGLLDEAERLYATDFSPSLRPIPAVRAGLLADHGYLEAPLAWARERGLKADDDLDYLREFEHVSLARVMIAEFRATLSPQCLVDAIRLLERVAVEAADAGRNGDLLQVLILLAVAEDARGDRPKAVTHLERAISIAEPEGYLQTFLDAGPRLDPLLRFLVKAGTSSALVRRVLDLQTGRPDRRVVQQSLIDPLSDRELEVLQLLTSELSGPEIASELMVSVNTVRTHTKNIYSKLGVTSRRAAVRRAEELRLLSGRLGD
ncbi:MAG: LuxR C-terminal-related transcriptional regulator [Microthrixaceae bacterium]